MQTTLKRHPLEFAQPLADRVIVRLDKPAEHTPGGLVLPENTIKHERPQFGTIHAVGPGRKLDRMRLVAGERGSCRPYRSEAERVPLDVKVGQRVAFVAYSGASLGTPRELGCDDDVDYLILREEDLLVVIPNKTGTEEADSCA